MKHNIKFKLFGLFAVVAMLLTTACKEDLLSEEMFDQDGYSVVSFTIQPEGLSTAATRADGVSGNRDGLVDYSQPVHISDGTKAKMLIYAVYNEEGELLPEFGQREREAAEQGKELSGIQEVTLPNGSILGEGQTYVDIDAEEGKGFPVTVELRLRRGETYKVAFWAQDKSCKFYDIANLKEVKIHYAEIEAGEESSTPNNDESRDAFCRVEEIQLNSKADENRHVILYRPLAQINVGTTGYDYETAVKMKKYAYTRIQITTVARYLDVVNDEIKTGETGEAEGNDLDKESAMEFGWARIPAYIYCEENDDDWENGVPKDLSELQENEEFLKVHLYKSEDINDKDYMGRTKDENFCDYATLKNDGMKTETFKYLSMCYVLVPSTFDDENNTYNKTTLDRVRVWIATDAKGADEKQIVDITNVDATRNWRTNIVGDIMTTDVPFQVVLDPIYAGDYNGFYEGGEVTWSGWLDKGRGAYYDAKNDEILISNANGLLWLQQMVNGELVYTKDNGTSVKAGDAIKYYGEEHKAKKDDEHTFGEDGDPSYFKGIPDPTKDLSEGDDGYKEAAELKARILRATHQDKNKGYNAEKQSWPANNNFHFVGEDGPAKVKLIADIDLTGIEWLGIGFDSKMDQTADMLGDNEEEKGATNKDSEIYDKAKHRGFFGHFDGNGHTVSNLTTKRFSMDVHPASFQQGSSGPYEAVQWYARGFFGQLGGNAIVENLTLRNVDIRGFHCVGGIAGAAIGVDEINKKGTNIVIKNCVVDGGYIENVPMYRGDVQNEQKGNSRTWSRGVNTGGIVGLYNASGSIEGCRVSNLTINGYRVVGGIVGCIDHYYLAYPKTGKFTDSRETIHNDANTVRPSSITNNSINNTMIIADHCKPFETPYHGFFNKNGYDIKWAYGFSWNSSYKTYVDYLVGGANGSTNVDNAAPPILSDVQLIDISGDVEQYVGRTTDLDNVPVNLLPIMDNWFFDDVKVKSNLIGEAAAYKRYKTTDFAFYSKNSEEMFKSPFPMFTSYDRKWVKKSGCVGMYVGAVTLSGKDETTGKSYVLSVRKATGEKDCAVLITACDRKQFKGNENEGWYSDAKTTFSNLSVRGNPYAYTGICLSPNDRMSKITIDNVAVYDVYQTIALAKLKKAEDGVWPLTVDASSVDLEVKNSNLRGYTVPGAGWKSIKYENVVFEKGARILSNDDANLETEYTCQVDADATFTDCTFKAPFIINIAGGVIPTFKNCKATYAGKETDDISLLSGKTKIIVSATGKVTYE